MDIDKILNKYCEGVHICRHRRRWNQCRDCGTGLCTHGSRKGQCRKCGTGYCIHKHRAYRCKQCKMLKLVKRELAKHEDKK